MHRASRTLSRIAIATFLAACGGGGSGGSPPPPPPSAFSLSGTIAGPYVEGIALTLGGAATASAVSGAGGTYAFRELAPGTYTVTPSLAGYVFTPPRTTIVIQDADRVFDFTQRAALSSRAISGTVSYAGSKRGRIYVEAYRTSCPDPSGCHGAYGTSLAAPGPFTIRGLPAGSYTLFARLDTFGRGLRHHSFPAARTGELTLADADLSNVSLTLVEATASVPPPPGALQVYAGNGAARIRWSPAWDATSGLESATGYRVAWGTDAAASTGGGTADVAPGMYGVYWACLPNGASYYFKVASISGTAVGSYGAVVGPVTIGRAEGNTVSGSITFPGIATGPLLVRAGDSIACFPNPSSPQAYSVPGVASGIAQVSATLDQNAKGLHGDGDDLVSVVATLEVAGDVAQDLALVPAPAGGADVYTEHSREGAHERYDLSCYAWGGGKDLVAATIVSASGVATPVDVSVLGGGASLYVNDVARPSPGDAYRVRLTYADGTTETHEAPVTVLDAFAEGLAVAGTPSADVPTLSWGAPSTPPASYWYDVGIPDTRWWIELGRTRRSVQYDANGRAAAPALTAGTSYRWYVAVRDEAGNSATTWSTYTP